MKELILQAMFKARVIDQLSDYTYIWAQDAGKAVEYAFGEEKVTPEHYASNLANQLRLIYGDGVFDRLAAPAPTVAVHITLDAGSRPLADLDARMNIIRGGKTHVTG